jgi:hypothetical protein
LDVDQLAIEGIDILAQVSHLSGGSTSEKGDKETRYE